MSAKLSTNLLHHNGGGSIPPHHHPAARLTAAAVGAVSPARTPPVSLTAGSGSPFAPLRETTRPRKLLGPSDMVKTERTIDDDGVDLSYDSTNIKKESNPSTDHNNSSKNLDVINRLKSEGYSALTSSTSSSHFSQSPNSQSTSAVGGFGGHSMPPQPASPASSRGSVGTAASGGGSAGGRLKFFKEGRVLLELTHRNVSEGEKVHWVPSGNKKVYWPPGPAPLTSRLDSNASTNTVTGSDGSLETGSHASAHHSPSPWGSPSPRLPPWQPAPSSRQRVKSIPSKLVKKPSKDLVFAMKPPQGVKNYRKKIRPFRRRCRQPGADIKINAFVLKLEIQPSAGKVKLRRNPAPSRTVEQRAIRLEDNIAKIVTKKSQVQVPITAWRVGRTDLANLIKNPPSEPGSPVSRMAPASPVSNRMRPASPQRIYPASPVERYRMCTQMPGGGMKVKSELKLVTETCTSPITAVPSPARPNKVKAETRTVSAETRPIPVRTLPITPTIGRVKSEQSGGATRTDGGHPAGLDAASPGRGIKMAALTSLMTPEMARVRMEIGPTPHHDREPSFASPRKRFLKDYEGAASGPSPKHRRLSTEHRLSTDSLGSTGDRASPYLGQGSPLPAAALASRGAGPASGLPHHLHTPHQQHQQQDVKPFSPFSIDNLISGSAAASPHASLAARLAADAANSQAGLAARLAAVSGAASASSASSPTRHRRDSNQFRSVTPNPSLSLRTDLTAPHLHSNSVPDSPGKVHAPTPTRPRGTSRDSNTRPASSPPSSSNHGPALPSPHLPSHQQRVPPPSLGGVGGPVNPMANFMNPFLYAGAGGGAAQNPLAAAAAASQQIAYLAAIQNQANMLTQQLREQGLNPAVLQHALQQQQQQQMQQQMQQQQQAALAAGMQQQQQAALAAGLPGGLLQGMPPGGPGYPFAMHPAFNPYLAAVSAAGGFPPTSMAPSLQTSIATSMPSSMQPSSVWMPPVGAQPTPPNSNSSGQRETPTPKSGTCLSPGYPSSSTSQAPPTSLHGGGQHTTLLQAANDSFSPPISNSSGEIKREGSQRQSLTDAPLNLCLKPTSL